MKSVLALVSLGETVTGLALLFVPALVVTLLFGVEPAGVVIPIVRVTGIALVALGIACWPGPPLGGMLIYSAAVTLYLAYIGFAGDVTGVLLWPAVAVHASLTLLLARVWYRDRAARVTGNVDTQERA